MKITNNFILSISLKLVSLISISYILIIFVFFSAHKSFESSNKLNDYLIENLNDRVLLFNKLYSSISELNSVKTNYSLTEDPNLSYELETKITTIENKLSRYFRELEKINNNNYFEEKREFIKLEYKKLLKTQTEFDSIDENKLLLSINSENAFTLKNISLSVDSVSLHAREKVESLFEKNKQEINNTKTQNAYVFIILTLLLTITIILIYTKINKPVHFVKFNLKQLSLGVIPKYKLNESKDEIGQLSTYINKLTDNQDDILSVLSDLSVNRLDSSIELKSSNDLVYKAINTLKEGMLLLNTELDVKKDSESERDWVNLGLAKFSNILREHNSDLNILFEIILEELIKYIGAVQGAIFTVEGSDDSDESEKYLKMQNSYAYDIKRIADKRILFNEGLIGRCAIERKAIYVTDVPENHLSVNSGLGKSKPTSLLLFPLVHDKKIYGIIELAFFKELNLYEQEFAEKLGETIASSIFNIKINMNTTSLLQKTQLQAQKMALKERMMSRQLDELKETQVEANRKEEASLGFVAAVNHTVIRADFDLNGKLLYANTKFYEITEYSSRDAEGKHYSTFLEPEDRADFDKEWDRISNGGKHYEADVKYRTKTGHVYLFVTYTIVRDAYANLDKVLLLAIDTSKRISKENEMARVIKAFEDNSIKAEFALDGTLLSYSEKFMEISGLNEEIIKGKNIPILLKKEKIIDIEIIWQNAKTGIEFVDILTFSNPLGIETKAKVSIFPIENMNHENVKIILLACPLGTNN